MESFAPRALMIQGTGSHVGKSLVVAGLCRAYARRGLVVRPFKPQNMSNNAAVAADGGEIGRAQALQARAAFAAPSRHMNPVLLKPQGETGAQVVVQGRVLGAFDARAYVALRPTLLASVLESFAAVAVGADLVLAEGAGSPAEVNLRDGDIANMGFALAAGVPVVLVADIERGGAIASLVGTHALLDLRERRLVKGFIVNKFRGDPRLFDDGTTAVERRCGLSCFGVVPVFERARLLPQEDTLALAEGCAAGAAAEGGTRTVKIAVPRLPRIANFDDLDPLAAEADVRLSFIEHGEALPGDADVVLLAGSKTTLADLAFLKAQGWDVDILAHRRRGGIVIGLCGGYQMLGRRIADPEGIEGAPGSAEGLGLLDVETVIGGEKTLAEARGREASTSETVRGYEMHMGRSLGPGAARPWLILAGGRAEGAVSEDGRVMGGYLHGLFAADGFRRAFLARVRRGEAGTRSYERQVEDTLDALADHLGRHLDLERLLAAAEPVAAPSG